LKKPEEPEKTSETNRFTVLKETLQKDAAGYVVFLLALSTGLYLSMTHIETHVLYVISTAVMLGFFTTVLLRIRRTYGGVHSIGALLFVSGLITLIATLGTEQSCETSFTNSYCLYIASVTTASAMMVTSAGILGFLLYRKLWRKGRSYTQTMRSKLRNKPKKPVGKKTLQTSTQNKKL